jgi:hypothetical protein
VSQHYCTNDHLKVLQEDLLNRRPVIVNFLNEDSTDLESLGDAKKHEKEKAKKPCIVRQAARSIKKCKAELSSKSPIIVQALQDTQKTDLSWSSGDLMQDSVCPTKNKIAECAKELKLNMKRLC